MFQGLIRTGQGDSMPSSAILYRHHPVPDADSRLNVLLAAAVLFELFLSVVMNTRRDGMLF